MFSNKLLLPAALLPSFLILSLTGCTPAPEKSETELSPPATTEAITTTETTTSEAKAPDEKPAVTTEAGMGKDEPRPTGASKKTPDWRPISGVKSREKGEKIAEIFVDKNSIVKDGEKYTYVMHAKNLSNIAALPKATSLEGTFSGTCGKDTVTVERETYFDAQEKTISDEKADMVQKIPAHSPGALIQEFICKDMAKTK